MLFAIHANHLILIWLKNQDYYFYNVAHVIQNVQFKVLKQDFKYIF